ncbi:hypothetical protein CISIN_1g048526mg, partial [Citrus sinensis]
NSALWRSLRDGDFEEADVWAVLKERKDSTYSKADQSPSQVQRNLYMPSAARMITRTSSSNNNNNNNNNATNGLKQQQQSAPVKTPDWSKISHKKSKLTRKKFCFRLICSCLLLNMGHHSSRNVENGMKYLKRKMEKEVV